LKKREIEIDSRENVHIQVKGLQKYNLSEGFELNWPTTMFTKFILAYALIINKL